MSSMPLPLFSILWMFRDKPAFDLYVRLVEVEE